MIGLILAEVRNRGWVAAPWSDRLPANHFEAILLPFTLLLLAEVISLIFALARSVSAAVAKQLEIMSLILVRQSFKELTYLDEHGRATLKTLCLNGGAQDPATIDEVACVPGTAIMADWTGHSIDGHVKARAEPWASQRAM